MNTEIISKLFHNNFISYATTVFIKLDSGANRIKSCKTIKCKKNYSLNRRYFDTQYVSINSLVIDGV